MLLAVYLEAENLHLALGSSMKLVMLAFDLPLFYDFFRTVNSTIFFHLLMAIHANQDIHS